MQGSNLKIDNFYLVIYIDSFFIANARVLLLIVPMREPEASINEYSTMFMALI